MALALLGLTAAVEASSNAVDESTATFAPVTVTGALGWPPGLPAQPWIAGPRGAPSREPDAGETLGPGGAAPRWLPRIDRTVCFYHTISDTLVCWRCEDWGGGWTCMVLEKDAPA